MRAAGHTSGMDDEGGRGNYKRKRERDIQAKESNKQAQRRFRDRQKVCGCSLEGGITEVTWTCINVTFNTVTTNQTPSQRAVGQLEYQPKVHFAPAEVQHTRA